MNDSNSKYPHVKVTPERWPDHPSYADLVRIKDVPNYYCCLLNGRITYKRGKTKIKTPFNTLAKAKKHVEEELAIRSGQQNSEKRKRHGVHSLLIQDVWFELMELKRVESAPRTMAVYHKSWEYGLKGFWKDKTLRMVNGESLLNYKIWYLKNHPTRGFHHTGIHLGMMLRYAIKMGYIDRLPDLEDLGTVDAIIIRNTRREKPGRIASPAEIEALIGGAKRLKLKPGHDHYSNSKHRELIACRGHLGVLLAARSGMRKMEILSMRWDEVDLEGRIIKRWSQKNMHWRLIPITLEVRDALREQLKITGSSPFVFPMPSNPQRHLSSQIFDKQWVRIKELAGIKGRFRFHDLRHTFATMTSEAGMPPLLACEILDMSLKIYSTVYCKPSFAVKAEWIERTFGVKPKEVHNRSTKGGDEDATV